MRTLILLICLGFCTHIANAQTSSSPILMRGGKCFQDGKRLAEPALINLLKSNSDAYKQYVKHNNLEICGFAFFIGAVGFGLAAGLSDDKSAIQLEAAVGITFLAISVPFWAVAPSKRKKAVHLYNLGIEQKEKPKVSPGFGMTPNGIGLIIKL